MGSYNMKVTTENAINKHFDQAAERIRMMAMPDAKGRLLIANEEERSRYLQEFRKAGEIKVRAVGQEWDLILDSDIYRIRKMSGLSRKDFAMKYHIPIRTLEKWEREEVNPAEYLVEWLERIVNEDFGGIHRMTKRDLINYIVESEKAYTGLESVKGSFERYEEYKALAKEQGYSADGFDNDIWSQVTRKIAISKGVYRP